MSGSPAASLLWRWAAVVMGVCAVVGTFWWASRPTAAPEEPVRPAGGLWPSLVRVPPADPVEGVIAPPRRPLTILRLCGRGAHPKEVVLTDPPRGLDAATGKGLWAGKRNWPVPLPEPTGPFVLPIINRMRLLPVAPDLDLDRTGDLVWLFDPQPAIDAPRHPAFGDVSDHPALLAVSGRTHLPLWSYPPPRMARPGLEPLLEGGRTTLFPLHGAPVGDPAVRDLDSDGVPDLVVTMQGTTGRRWLVALSGRTGCPLWYFDPGPELLNNSRPTPEPAAVVSVGPAPRVVWASGCRLFLLDAATGRPAAPALHLETAPLLPPRVADLAGKGERDVVLLCPRGRNALALVVYTLASGQLRWEQRIEQAAWEHALGDRRETVRGPYRTGAMDPPLIADLDGDGVAEIVVASWQQIRGDGLVDEAAVVVLDGATGELRWRHPMSSRHWRPMQLPLRVTVGPDLDGDGVREVFVATKVREVSLVELHFPGRLAETFALYVDALRGADGASHWWRRFPLLGNRRVEPLTWAFAAAGQSYLGIPLRELPGGDMTLWWLEAAQGKVQRTVEELSFFEVADMDGDGDDEVCVVRGGGRDGARQLEALRIADGDEEAGAEQSAMAEIDPRHERPLPWSGAVRSPAELAALAAGIAGSLAAILLLVHGLRWRPAACRMMAAIGVLAVLAWGPIAAWRFTSPASMAAATGTLVALGLFLHAAVGGRWRHSLALLGAFVVAVVVFGGLLLGLDDGGVNYSLRGWPLLGLYAAAMTATLSAPLELLRERESRKHERTKARKR